MVPISSITASVKSVYWWVTVNPQGPVKISPCHEVEIYTTHITGGNNKIASQGKDKLVNFTLVPTPVQRVSWSSHTIPGCTKLRCEWYVCSDPTTCTGPEAWTVHRYHIDTTPPTIQQKGPTLFLFTPIFSVCAIGVAWRLSFQRAGSLVVNHYDRWT